MGIFEHFPYTNYHDQNLDWLLTQVKNNTDEIKSLESLKNYLEEIDPKFFVVTVTKNGDDYTADATISDIEAALAGGITPIFIFVRDNYRSILTSYNYSESFHRFICSDTPRITSTTEYVQISRYLVTLKITEGVDTITVVDNSFKVPFYVAQTGE